MARGGDVLQASCCAEAKGCVADTSCFDQVDRVSTCQGEGGKASCVVAFSLGKTLLDGLNACLDTQCNTSCGP